ncbi:MAG: preprotein translocase subunit SecE [Bacilli bacterium]|nr:preprotein translocase subunit SecE [Bacilli bacterium]MDD4282432.1 preprotein translocase subunit SecE [Bacilli bacterium]MDD4718902.1 preprotein translocase subunit SecE [Bacilli bacterium]
MKKIFEFLKEVKKEMKKVRWPNKKEMVTYSVATISFIVLFAFFFSLTDIVLAALKTLVK